MKKRIKMDGTLMSFTIILTGIFCFVPQLYWTSRLFDNICDFLGLIVLLQGVYLRMASRGFKKAHSEEGAGLVKTGLYAYVRNPMYLGSFLIGGGFALIVWPWWSLPIFAFLFYLRFNRQVRAEEEHLSKLFGKDYEVYCQEVPRIFPGLSSLKEMQVHLALSWSEARSTKEKKGLGGFVLMAFILEIFQEKMVFGLFNIRLSLLIFLLAVMVFVLGLLVPYQKAKTA